jgi:hypothetical protein
MGYYPAPMSRVAYPKEQILVLYVRKMPFFKFVLILANLSVF